jgi:hypothetical protein
MVCFVRPCLTRRTTQFCGAIPCKAYGGLLFANISQSQRRWRRGKSAVWKAKKVDSEEDASEEDANEEDASEEDASEETDSKEVDSEKVAQKGQLSEAGLRICSDDRRSRWDELWSHPANASYARGCCDIDNQRYQSFSRKTFGHCFASG